MEHDRDEALSGADEDLFVVRFEDEAKAVALRMQARAWGLTPEEALVRIALERLDEMADLAFDEEGTHAFDS